MCWRYTEISFKCCRLKTVWKHQKVLSHIDEKNIQLSSCQLTSKNITEWNAELNISNTPSIQVFTFLYGHYHSKFVSTTTSDTAIFMRVWLENYTCYLPSTCCQSRLLHPLMTCQRRIWLDPGKVRDWCHICKSFLKWNLTKLAPVNQPGLWLG